MSAVELPKNNNVVEMDKELAELMEKEIERSLSGFTLLPLRFSIKHADGKFVLPDNTEVESLEGVILSSKQVRAYWADTDENRATCLSTDLIIGHTADGEERKCAVCPYNKWGSATVGDGKACKEKRLLLFLPDGMSIPLFCYISTSSIKSFDEYATMLFIQKKALIAVKTKMTLEIRRKGAAKYSIVHFATVGETDVETIKQLILLRSAIESNVDEGYYEEAMNESESEIVGAGDTEEEDAPPWE